MKIVMIVAAHKAYRMPEDPMYLPLHVGKAGKSLELGFQGDDTGDNISEKNPEYCELTGLYWAWKNLDADYIGLSHYRRYFRGKRGGDKWDCILTTAQAEHGCPAAKKTKLLDRNSLRSICPCTSGGAAGSGAFAGGSAGRILPPSCRQYEKAHMDAYF